jgi:NAD(P)-dependent dehydrogenase (short-subunit alcohol dehydrogenase family)
MNKNIVITGVSSGFGLATAAELLTRGYRVFGSVRKAADASKVSDQLRSPGFTPLLFDVTDHAAIAEAVSQLTTEVDAEGIAGLVNNAGVGPLGPLEHTPVQQVRDIFEVNVFGALAVTQAFLPLLKRKEKSPDPAPGRIINISSTSGGVTFPMVGAYSASKYALESLNDAFRRELSRYGISVIAIEPGSIRTPIWDKTSAAGADEPDPFAGTAYEKVMAQMPAFLEQRLKGAKPISVVTDAIAHALETPKPRARYPLDPTWYAGKYLGDRLMDTIIKRQMPKG